MTSPERSTDRATGLHVALFGTSADPPHRGHAAILAWLATQFDHVAVWTANNPFKAHQTDLGDRFRMLELLIDELDAPPQRVQVHPELSHRRTVVTLERARQIWPGARFALVVGADLLKPARKGLTNSIKSERTKVPSRTRCHQRNNRRCRLSSASPISRETPLRSAMAVKSRFRCAQHTCHRVTSIHR
nr:adenylyltransferase/cytidyltransferase family protein [Leptolyngbya sp. KIOST-1]